MSSTASSVMGTDPIRTWVFAAREALPEHLIGPTPILSLGGTAPLFVPAIQTLPVGEAVGDILLAFCNPGTRAARWSGIRT